MRLVPVGRGVGAAALLLSAAALVVYMSGDRSVVGPASDVATTTITTTTTPTTSSSLSPDSAPPPGASSVVWTIPQGGMVALPEATPRPPDARLPPCRVFDAPKGAGYLDGQWREEVRDPGLPRIDEAACFRPFQEAVEAFRDTLTRVGLGVCFWYPPTLVPLFWHPAACNPTPLSAQLGRLGAFLRAGHVLSLAGDSLSMQLAGLLSCLVGADVRQPSILHLWEDLRYPTVDVGPWLPQTYRRVIEPAEAARLRGVVRLSAPTEQLFDEWSAAPPERHTVVIANVHLWLSRFILQSANLTSAETERLYDGTIEALFDTARRVREMRSSKGHLGQFVFIYRLSTPTGCAASRTPGEFYEFDPLREWHMTTSRNERAARLAEKYGIPVLDDYHLLADRNDAKLARHEPSAGDCLHYCSGDMTTPLVAVLEAIATLLDADLGLLPH